MILLSENQIQAISSEIELLNNTIDTILSDISSSYPYTEFPAANLKDFVSKLEDFHDFKEENYTYYVHRAIRLKDKPNSGLIFLIYQHEVEKISRHTNRVLYKNTETITEIECIAYTQLDKSYGRTFIRPETISDKVSEFFYSKEIDFEETPEFSANYFVVSKNKEVFKSNISVAFTEAVNRRKDWEIETNGQFLIARLDNSSAPENIKDFIQLILELN
ncbi:MAG: hypothetical protein U0U66_10260 [Cytophagaceae bacterium]